MVSKTRLLKAERPQRGKGSWPSEPSVGRQDMLCVRPIKNVVVERASLRAKGVGVRGFFTKIEACSPGVVQQHPGGNPSTRRQEKWNCFVDRIGGFLKAIAVSVPKVIGMIAPFEWPRLVAQCKIAFLGTH